MKFNVFANLSCALLICLSCNVVVQDIIVHCVCLGAVWAVLISLAVMYMVQPAATWSVVAIAIVVLIAVYFYKDRYSITPALEDNASNDSLTHRSEKQSPEKLFGTLRSCDIDPQDYGDEGECRNAEYTNSVESPTEMMFSSKLLNEFVSNIPNWEENPVDSRTQAQECFDVDHISKERNVEPRKVTSAPDKTWREISIVNYYI